MHLCHPDPPIHQDDFVVLVWLSDVSHDETTTGGLLIQTENVFYMFTTNCVVQASGDTSSQKDSWSFPRSPRPCKHILSKKVLDFALYVQIMLSGYFQLVCLCFRLLKLWFSHFFWDWSQALEPAVQLCSAFLVESYLDLKSCLWWFLFKATVGVLVSWEKRVEMLIFEDGAEIDHPGPCSFHVKGLGSRSPIHVS